MIIISYSLHGHDTLIYFQVLVVAGLGMLPILPKHLADRACKLSLLGTILSSAYSLYSTYGVISLLLEARITSTIFNLISFFFRCWSVLFFCAKKPRAWNMPAVQGWLQAVLGTKDFIHLMFSLMLFTSQLHLKSNTWFPFQVCGSDLSFARFTSSYMLCYPFCNSCCTTCVLLGTWSCC